MKFSEQWLREWVNPDWNSDDLVRQLTMAGLEVDSADPVAGEFSNVVVGKVLSCKKHPDAEKLTLCQVDVGESNTLAIVCGAANVRENLFVAVAKVGAKLPGGMKIKKSTLRGEESLGMLCSASELGLAEEAEGILELADDAPIGDDIRDYLGLNDMSIDVDLTPNRGDCLSVAGIAREVGVLSRNDVTRVDIVAVPADIKDVFKVKLSAPNACAQYVGRVIRGINPAAQTPVWMQEKLRRSGLRSISPVVDVTNFVMLELGQPMHAFDLQSLEGHIDVRMAKKDEALTLLDGKDIKIPETCLVIADAKKAIALAGIMGGEATAVTDNTQDIFLESAFFAPEMIAGKARLFGLATDSSHRFERGVDPELQRAAIERATVLLQAIVGGQVGPIIEVNNDDYVPKPKLVTLRHQRIKRVLGIDIPKEEELDILQRLDMTIFSQGDAWEVRVPTHRFDITLEEDLIEEVARVYGYNKIPVKRPQGTLFAYQRSEQQLLEHDFADALIARNYHEVISYSFVDKKLQQLIEPDQSAMALLNPISPEMSVMRSSLWAGLLQTMQYNQHRQQMNQRLYEVGLCFIPGDDELVQEKRIAGVITGQLNTAIWDRKEQDLDFFDAKADVEAMLALTGAKEEFRFVAEQHPALHPGQSARIVRNDQAIGWLGAVHPSIISELDLVGPMYVFELQCETLANAPLPKYSALSKYPAIRRDLSFLVDEQISVQAIKEKIANSTGEILKDVSLFDLYQGQGIESGEKSLAIGLTLQHPSRTLTDAEVAEFMDNVLVTLQQAFAVKLRD